jgi:hypothetical protein
MDRPNPDLNRCLTLLTKIGTRSDARPFARPMSELWDPEELTEYFKVIKSPMDLRTVREKLQRGGYNSGGPEAFANDVRQIFKNCTTWTPDLADPYNQAAKLLLKWFETEFTAITNPQAAAVAKPVSVTNFEKGDVVWVKVGSYPWWPGQIQKDPKSGVAQRKDKKFYLHFYGDGTHGW